MATIITKYSDYGIHSIEFFISKLETEIPYRDMKGLTNSKIELISITKQHPLATLMSAQLNENRNLEELRANILPAISVTPGNPTEEGMTLGQSYKPELVDSDFIAKLIVFYNKTNKEIQQDVLITKDQIDLITGAYKKGETGSIRAQVHEWRKNDETNISVWSSSPDIDVLMANILDSIMSDLQVGFTGEDSKLRNFKYRITRGLTNFNFGRVIFGTEFSLTFLNTYSNYTIYSDDVLSGFETDFTLTVPGE